MSMRKATTTWVAIGAMATLVAACDGGPETGSSAVAATGANSIAISGSSTVEPISARVGERFDAANPSNSTTVEGPGTGDGFARLCAGEIDISDASRPIKDAEAEDCAANGIEYVELHIATDGLTVMTNPSNTTVDCLTFADLYALTGPESEGLENWSEANALAAELGGFAGFPDADLVVVGPGEESGTYDTYVEFVISDIAEERGQEESTRADYEASANDNVVVQGIAGNPTSIGWVGFAFFEQNADVLRAVEIDGGNGCVLPTIETIASFEYPLSRPLFIYVKTNELGTKSALVEFVDFYLSDEGVEAVGDAGYVELPAEDLEATRAAWAQAKG